MSTFSRSFFYSFLFSTLFLMAGCAPSFYNVKQPAPSGLKYAVPAELQSLQLSITDERRGQDKTFSSGILPAALKINGQPIDPPKFLADAVTEELKSRGIPTTYIIGGNNIPLLHLKQFHMLNFRSSGFAPFYSFTYLKADLETDGGTKRIAAHIRRGKTPVWSFDEIIEPTLNQPLDLVIKEFASKLANALYGYRASDNTVQQLVSKISGAHTAETYRDVYALGFTNNPAAIKTLVELTADADENIREAAISSLGNINAVDQLKLLKDIYTNSSRNRQDRDVAIKAIGDLGTQEAILFIKQESEKISKFTDSDSIWSSRVMALYL